MRVFISIAAMLVVTGCSDPLAAFDRLRDVDLAPDAPSGAAALPTSEEVAREGFFGTSAAEAQAVPQTPKIAAQKPSRNGGLFGLFRRKSDTDSAVEAALNDVEGRPAVPNNASVEVVTLTPEAAAPAPDVVPIKRGGLLGLLRPKRTPEAQTAAAQLPRSGPDAQDVAPGTILPFGVVARVCEAKGRALGKRVEKAPASGFALYDTDPQTTGPRSFHITGFNDGCARQFTAATVVLSSAETYEQFRFGPAGKHLPQGDTDAAYARIKRQACGAGKNKPCGAQIKTLNRSTFFVSSYRDLGQTGGWSELLIHQGGVVAAAQKSYN